MGFAFHVMSAERHFQGKLLLVLPLWLLQRPSVTGQVATRAARAETGEARMETLATAGTAAAPGEAVPGVVEAVQGEGAGHDLPLG